MNRKHSHPTAMPSGEEYILMILIPFLLEIDRPTFRKPTWLIF